VVALSGVSEPQGQDVHVKGGTGHAVLLDSAAVLEREELDIDCGELGQRVLGAIVGFA
jgi:hypothetical protein